MARLAAYYQEDFHYAPIGYGAKQRKAAYLLYDEPKNNLFNENYVNGGSRMRALASSDPSLSPTYSPKNGVMTLKTKPHNNKLVEQSRMAVQRLDNLYEPSAVLNPYAVARLEADMLECESMHSQTGTNWYGERYATHRHQLKDNVCKRLSYNDSYEGSQYVPQMCTELAVDRYQSPNAMQVQSCDNYHGEPYQRNEQYQIEQNEQCYTPPISFRSDSSHGRWQQWPWNMVDTHASPAILSPSPLDSGLSSQSITSSPSLEAEPTFMHKQIQAIRPEIHHVCSCSPMAYAEPGRIISSPGRYDSGRSSPGTYSVASRCRKSRKSNGKHFNNGIVYIENDFENQYSQGQIRYGMLGIVNEPIQPPPALNGISNGHSPEYIPNNHAKGTYYYVEENGGPVKVPEKRSSKLHNSQPKQSYPSVIIVEASDKSASSGSPTSPEQDHSDKSPEPESSISPSASNSASDPSTTTFKYNDAENKEKRKSRKKTEKDIRELEDMYQKCNLGDYDLLERAERRDLPTAHQLRVHVDPPRLTRSKSDTLYEMVGSTYKNPYDVHHRAPPLRRAGVPDIIEDDMALRKLKKSSAMAALNPADNTVTYMLCSSHFTPTVSTGRDYMLIDNPDVEYDDLSYRKHYFGKKSKIQDPQPPFGIPLRPPPPQCVYNDYLHAVPNGGPQPLCHPRGNPDVVRDDLAFRTLRKDEQEKFYYEVLARKRRV